MNNSMTDNDKAGRIDGPAKAIFMHTNVEGRAERGRGEELGMANKY